MDTAPGNPESTTAWLNAGGARGLQVGSQNVQHNHFGYDPPAVRSAYLEQVRRIAPPELRDRDAELADLVAFCTSDSEHVYMWWLASAWAGKSALMSWFALHPPPGVRIVCFFVTGRHHRQNDRKAFIDNLLEQLAEVLGHRGLPVGLTDSTQEAHLAGMLSGAAAACQRSGERLVLLVDGLDEDRGVTVGPESYSIAATLPRYPPGGLRIVVSSRPDPPLPPDVPTDHPLRSGCQVRELKPSAHAQVVRIDAERELKRMLHAGGIEQDILGFVTAAHSGLSAPDLADLIGQDEWLVEDYLTSFTGRTFARNGTAYVLAHEELQPTATKLLGSTRLRGYRQRLHEWADRYRDLGWPIGTPDYLLRGYFRMLSEQGDTARLVRHAVDADRHDRMLDHTGGDAVALEEVTLAQDALLASTNPDLPAMCKLAIRRADLEERNKNLPLALPQLWAAVGNLARAEAIVRSIPEDGHRRHVALIWLAPEVAAAGDHNRAELLLGMIPSNVKVIDTDEPSKTACEVVRKIARNGDLVRAMAVADGIDGPFWQSKAYCEIAIALSRREESLADAEAHALRIPMPYWRAQTLAVLAAAAAEVRQNDLAERLAGSAERETKALTDAHRKAIAYAVLAREIKTWGGLDRAMCLLNLAEQAAVTTDRQHRAETISAILPILAKIANRSELASLASMAESTLNIVQGESQPADRLKIRRLAESAASAWYTAGDYDRAVSIVNSMTEPDDRERALLGLVGTAAGYGDLDHARILVGSFADQAGRDRALGRIVASLPTENTDEDIAALIESIQDRATHATALTEWGYRAAKQGNLESAIELAERTEGIGRFISDPWSKAELLTPLASALIDADDVKRAQRAARRALEAHRAAEEFRPDMALATLIQVALRASDYETAMGAAALIKRPDNRVAAQVQLASSIAEQNDRERAVGLLGVAEVAAMSIPRQRDRAQTLGKILTALWAMGEDERADALAVRISERDCLEPSLPAAPQGFPAFLTDDESRSSLVARTRDESLAKAVEAAAATGDFDRADTLGDMIGDEGLRADARISVVLALARAGHHDCAYERARTDSDYYRPDECLRKLVPVLAEHGALELAEKVAHSIGNEFYRGKALIALARQVEPTRAQRLLLFPTRHGMLPEIVDLFVAVCPEAIDVIADMLLSKEGPSGPP
ncbi:hypothetical protein AB0B10_15585 [Micromonospora arborensis]|uniref:hypothetical protein n=1 Tax=Micromonospora arborensis TaxID=2116518 RepID=UPI0033DAD278